MNKDELWGRSDETQFLIRELVDEVDRLGNDSPLIPGLNHAIKMIEAELVNLRALSPMAPDEAGEQPDDPG